jgi:beta-galactosidase
MALMCIPSETLSWFPFTSLQGNFTPTADMSHGYLPFGIGWYRKHLTIPAAAAAPGTIIWLDVDGAQTASTIWINGYSVGSHASGYTHGRYFLNSSVLKFGADNVLALEVDATHPDGWWCELWGQGVSRCGRS